MSKEQSNELKLLKALSFAAEKHRMIPRKDADKTPYVNHLIAVAEVLARNGVTDIVILQAAILHDTIEDTNTSAEELTSEFGDHVTSLVLEVSDDKTLLKTVRKQQQIDHSSSLSNGAKLIKFGDKISNVTDVIHRPAGDWSVQRRLEYLAWAERVIAGCRGVNAGLEIEFDAALREGRQSIKPE